MDLTTTDGIKQFYDEVFVPKKERLAEWKSGYLELVQEVADATPEQIIEEAMQLKLWEDQSISGSGMCSIGMSDFATNKDSVEYIREFTSESLPSEKEPRLQAIETIRETLVKQVREKKSRLPKLKILRLLAAVFPFDMTCIVSAWKVKKTLKEMGVLIPKKPSPVRLNRMLLDRIAEAIGTSKDLDAAVTHSMFAWELFVFLVEDQDDEDEGEIETPIGDRKLAFLPQQKRRKGLVAISGYVETAIKVVDFTKNGVTREELAEFYKQESPGIKSSSVNTQLTQFRQSLGLLKQENDVLTPSPLGEELLESHDPNTLVERLLTHIVGFDVVLYELKTRDTLKKSDLYAALKRHYPKWTTDFAPSSLLAWSYALELVSFGKNQNVTLTESGKAWAALIPERPEPLTSQGDGDGDKPNEPFAPPTLELVIEFIASKGFVFEPSLVAKFHTALHMHASKHFVLLSGLSGTGKTKLAELYAHAYHGVNDGEINDYYLSIPVQPDWMDATGLIGYVNPLQQETTYETTSFLQFLHQALEQPDRPHFVCLDEMNLARVEYYFAPFLSAMETGGSIVIHQQDEPIDAVEPKLDWPANLFIIGTVNMDETTHAFSDKVLDRAFTLEFWDVDLDQYLASFRKRYPDADVGSTGAAFTIVRGLHAILQTEQLHFGYRVMDEVLLFVSKAVADAASVFKTSDVALDCAVQMKILPKLRGEDTPGLRKCFEQLVSFLEKNNLKESAVKCKEMNETLVAVGATQYWR